MNERKLLFILAVQMRVKDLNSVEACWAIVSTEYIVLPDDNHLSDLVTEYVDWKCFEGNTPDWIN